MKAMFKLFVFLLPLFLLLNIAQANNTCADLFGNEAIANGSSYRKYDPNNMDQIIFSLINKGELRKIKRADPDKTNLEFFNDYIEDAIQRLAKEKELEFNPSLNQTIDNIILDARLRIQQEQVTYNWVWKFSYQVLDVFETRYGHGKSTARNLDRILEMFPRDVMIPTFAIQDFRHFIDIDGYDFAFLGMRERSEYVDGNPEPFTPEQFLDHDILHHFLTNKGDHLLTLHDKNYRGWMKLHKQIRDHIQKLQDPEKSYVEFIYFYLLHEEFGMRDRLAYRFLNPKIGKMSEFAKRALDYQIIKDHFEGISHPENIEQSEIYKRIVKPYDFKEAFPDKTPQEVLLVGINGFVNIIKQIEQGSMPPEKKRPFSLATFLQQLF